MNFHIPNAKIKKFPADIIAKSGGPLFSLLGYLYGDLTELDIKSTDKIIKKSVKLKAELKNYGKLIKFLKGYGALLNTIRPENLISFSEYNGYMRTLEDDSVDFKYLRLTERKYRYISYDAWITLFY